MATKPTSAPASGLTNAASVGSANPAAKTNGDSAQATAQTPLITSAFTDIAATHEVSSTYAEHTFEVAKKPTFAGKPVRISYRRRREKVKEEQQRNPNKSRVKRALSSVADVTGINATGRGIYNSANKFFGFGYDYVEISEDEEMQIATKMDEAWKEYKEKYEKEHGEELKDEDVLHIGLEFNLVDEKPNLEKDFTCYVFLVKRDENGEIIYHKRGKDKGRAKERLVYLCKAKPSSDSVLAAVATAVDLTSEVQRNLYKNLQEFLNARENGFKESRQVTSKKSEEKSEVVVDKNICYLHAILNILKGLKSKEKQRKAFAKDKSAMDTAAMGLKEDLDIESSDQEDAEEMLRKALISQIDTQSRFAVETSRERSRVSFYSLGSVPIGSAEKSKDPMPFLALTGKTDLQGLLDDHHLVTDRSRLDTWTDESQYSKPKYQITKQHTQYTTKPPFLMLAIKRFKSEKGKVIKVEDPIEVPDILQLDPKKHITEAAASEPVKYPIKGFIYHEGEEASSGHFITYMLDFDGKWKMFDNLDENSYGKEVRETGDDSEFSKRKQRAYVYLYRDDNETPSEVK